MGKEIDESSSRLPGDCPEAAVDGRYGVGFSDKPSVTSRRFVDGEETLQVETGVGRFATNTRYDAPDSCSYAVNGEVVTDIVDAYHEEYFVGLPGQYLVEAFVETGGVVADDAAVADAVVCEAFAPVTSVFSEAVAEHDDVGGGDGRLILKSGGALAIVVCRRSRGSGDTIVDGSCHDVGYKGAKAHGASVI